MTPWRRWFASMGAGLSPRELTAKALCESAGISRNALYRYHRDVLLALHDAQPPPRSARGCEARRRPVAPGESRTARTVAKLAALVDHYFAAWQETRLQPRAARSGVGRPAPDPQAPGDPIAALTREPELTLTRGQGLRWKAMGQWCPVWRSAMNCDLGSNLVLARGLLRLFKLAVIDGHRGVADQLLCALERLARSDPGCEPILDHAYLWASVGTPAQRVCARQAGRSDRCRCRRHRLRQRHAPIRIAPVRPQRVDVDHGVRHRRQLGVCEMKNSRS